MRRPATSWKQCPAVITHVDETRAPEQALSRVLPPELGMPVIVSFTANGNCPSTAGFPLAIAAAGDRPTVPKVSTAPKVVRMVAHSRPDRTAAPRCRSAEVAHLLVNPPPSSAHPHGSRPTEPSCRGETALGDGAAPERALVAEGTPHPGREQARPPLLDTKAQSSSRHECVFSTGTSSVACHCFVDACAGPA